MPESEVRIANSQDVNDLIDLVREAHEEEPLGPSATLDEDKVFNVILQAMAKQAVIGVIGEPDELQSACFLELSKPWYSHTDIINCLLTYTRESFRKSQNTKSLYAWARRQSERLNCPIQVESASTETSKPKIGLLERIFGPQAGMSFHHLPNPEAPAAVEIEIATVGPESEPDVISVARELAAENGAYMPDDDMAIPLLRSALEGDGVIGVIRPDREIEGLIFLRVSSPWYSSEPFLDEYLLYVRPEYRKSQNAKALVQFAIRQSDRLNTPLRMGIISKIELSRKLALYERLLGQPVSSHFLFRPN